MKKRLVLVAIAVLLALLPAGGALSTTGAVVYGQSGGIVRSTNLPSENVHEQAQQSEITASFARLDSLERKIDAFQGQVNDLRVSSENQRTEVVGQLSNTNRELGAIKADLENLQAMQREIQPTLEQPREIIPPMSLVVLSLANVVLLVVVIMLIFWLRAQYKGLMKDSHLEEHAQIHLTDFIREAMHKGASLAEIRRRLVQRGWSEGRIDEALQEVRTMHAA